MRAQKRPRPDSRPSPSSLCQNLNSEQNDEFASINLSKIRKEVQCPICLGILRKTRTVVDCLHRFCKECIEKSMRTVNNECPLCRIHIPSRRSLRDDPQFDALIAAIYPDINKYEKEELAFHVEDGSSKKQIQDSTAQTSRQPKALGRNQGSDAEGGVEYASGTDFFTSLSTGQIGIKLKPGALAPGTQPSSSKSIEKLLQVYPATSCPPAFPKALYEACFSLCQTMSSGISQVVEAAGSEGENARKKVEKLQLQVSMQDSELTRYKLLAEAHKKEVDALTEELKMSTESRLDSKITELKTVEEEQASRLHKQSIDLDDEHGNNSDDDLASLRKDSVKEPSASDDPSSLPGEPTVVLKPDSTYIMGKRFSTASTLTFSRSSIKVEGSIVKPTNRSFEFTWKISDVNMKCFWYRQLESGMLYLYLRSGDDKIAEIDSELSEITELAFTGHDSNCFEMKEAIESLDSRYKIALDTEHYGVLHKVKFLVLRRKSCTFHPLLIVDTVDIDSVLLMNLDVDISATNFSRFTE